MDKKKFDRLEQYKRMLEIHDFFEKIIKKYKISKISMEKYYITTFNLKNAEFVYGMR
jgi:Holliday junction resolvasome RuvABC endonuclease subunit